MKWRRKEGNEERGHQERMKEKIWRKMKRGNGRRLKGRSIDEGALGEN